MNPMNILKDMQTKIEELMQNSPAKDVQSHVKTLMSNTFTKLDLVTREEFDIQKEVLQNTRQKLESLEKKLESLVNTTNPVTSNTVSSEESLNNINTQATINN